MFAIKSLENVAQFQYLGTIVTDENCIYEEIKNKLNSGNACYHFVQGIFSYHLSKIVRLEYTELYVYV
jgi:hypothetical protein